MSHTLTSPRLVLVTNIPSPYRLHSFTALQKELESHNIALEVFFMAATETGRFWQTQPEKWQFNGHIAGGIHPYWRGIDMHINPMVWASILKNAPTWLIIGGGWQFPTSIGLFLLQPFLRKRTRILVWVEANYRYSLHNNGFVAFVRRFLLSKVDGLILPGQVAKQTLEDHWKVNNKYVFWPNLVHEETYYDQVSRLKIKKDELKAKYNIPIHNRVLLWSARLHEPTKGILNFLARAHLVLDNRTTIIVAGEGPDRTKIEIWLRSAVPELDVRLMGHLEQSQMLECLALADVFILPSLRDPNPLSVIEALWAGLPILTSINCGNWPETVDVGENGWLVDPIQSEDVQKTVCDILSSSPERLSKMGEASLEKAAEQFASRTATRRFVDDLLGTFPPRGQHV